MKFALYEYNLKQIIHHCHTCRQGDVEEWPTGGRTIPTSGADCASTFDSRYSCDTEPKKRAELSFRPCDSIAALSLERPHARDRRVRPMREVRTVRRLDVLRAHGDDVVVVRLDSEADDWQAGVGCARCRGKPVEPVQQADDGRVATNQQGVGVDERQLRPAVDEALGVHVEEVRV